MRSKAIGLLTFLFSLGLLFTPAVAVVDETTINFESIPGISPTVSFFDGCCVVPTTARLSNQLQMSQGITFSSAAPYVVVARLGGGHATSGVVGIGGVNASNVIKYNAPVIITFSMPGSPATPAVTDFVSIRGDLHWALGIATMEAFDEDGNLIGQSTAQDIAGMTLSVTQPGIHSVRITQTRSDIAFDDLKFNTLTPAVSNPPTAEAGPDQSIHAGQTVTLNGSGSSDDNTSTENLVFQWTLTAKPDGSSAVLTAANTISPQFVVDLPGEYAASVTVTDEDGLTSAPDTVTVSSLNAAPVADAGMDRGGLVGQQIMFDGSASFDPDSDVLQYSWTLVAPDGSSVAIGSVNSQFPTFAPAVAGTYTATLTVTDPFGATSSDSVSAAVILSGQYAADRIADALNLIGGLSLDQVTTKGNRNALQKFLTQAVTALQQGDTAEAISKLEQALERTDGCILRGGPDGNGSGRDWVIDCGAQTAIYQRLAEAVNVLRL